MSIFDKIFRPTATKQPKVPYLINYGYNVPPDRTLQGYLSAYGEIGWLFAVVSRIAEGVSEVKWRLYSVNPKGERTLVYNHAILNLLDFVTLFRPARSLLSYISSTWGLLVNVSG